MQTSDIIIIKDNLPDSQQIMKETLSLLSIQTSMGGRERGGWAKLITDKTTLERWKINATTAYITCRWVCTLLYLHHTSSHISWAKMCFLLKSVFLADTHCNTGVERRKKLKFNFPNFAPSPPLSQRTEFQRRNLGVFCGESSWMVCHCVRNYRRNITQPGSYFTRKFPLRKAGGGAKKCKSPLPSSSTRAFHFVPFGEQCKDVSIIGSSPCRVSRWYLITWCYSSALIQYTGGPSSESPKRVSGRIFGPKLG